MEMNHSAPVTIERPSATRAFFGGFGSGAMSGALMIGIFALLSPFFGGAILTTLASAPLMIAATGLFGGIMSAKRAMFDAPAHAPHSPTVFVPTVVPSLAGPVLAPAMTPTMTYADQAHETALTSKNWVAQTGRTENRVEQILAAGLSDKDRASAILAERQAASLAEPARA
jgi:hypothetical protein